MTIADAALSPCGFGTSLMDFEMNCLFHFEFLEALCDA
jgi:hypothetical protein